MALATPGDRANVRSWDLVEVFSAPVGTTMPVDTATALNVAFKSLGLMSEDELTLSFEMDRTEHRSMGGELVKVKRQAQSRRFTFTALENSHEVFTVANPGSTATTATGITTRTVKKQTTLEKAVVIEATEGATKTRILCARAEVFSDGDRVLGPSGMYETPMTGVIYPASNGDLYVEITNDAAASAS